MISNRLATWLAARDIHYGWVVAATTFLTMLATAGAMGSAGVLIAPLETEFGWSNAEISAAMAVRLALFGLFAPFAAAFMNHFGLRQVVTTALALIIVAILLSFVMTEVWHLVAIWGIAIGVGTGMTALVLGATVATRWFEARRGLVVGLMTASNATGQLVFVPLLAALTDAHGWRTAMTVVVAVIAMAMVLVLLLMRDRPADLGLAPYGGRAIVPVARRAGSLADLLNTPIAVLADAARSSTFWALFATFFVCGLSTNGLIQTHWIAICGDMGLTVLYAAGLLAIIGLFDLVGTVASGWLSDRYDTRWLLFWFYGMRGLSLLYLPFSDFTLPTLLFFAAFYGLDWVATVPPTVKLAAERFGTERAAIVFGWVFTGHQLGAATATLFAGMSRTNLGTYVPAILVAGAACLLAAAMILTIRRSVGPEPQPKPA